MVHIGICICTCKRPEGLIKLLRSIDDQVILNQEDHKITYYIVDNYPQKPSRQAIDEYKQNSRYRIVYEVENTPGIPFARERSIRMAWEEDAIIFIDDDEVAPQGWLQALLDCWRQHQADVVAAPVKGVLPKNSPKWAYDCDLYDRSGITKTGSVLKKAYTGNTLVSKAVFQNVHPAFHPAFAMTGSSDLYFFMRVYRAGYRMIWCEEALVYEDVPLSRTTIKWLLCRGFRAGSGDTICRLLISPGIKTYAEVIALSFARFGQGIISFLSGIITIRMRLIVKGMRRISSGIGSFAGLFGINYKEYQHLFAV